MKPLSADTKNSLEQAVSQYQAALLADRAAIEAIKARGFLRDSSERFRLGVVDSPLAGLTDRHVGCVVLPNINAAGRVVGMKLWRYDHGEDQPKYDAPAGQQARLWHTRAIAEAGPYIAIVEGEWDAIALDLCGIPAVAVPGVQTWKAHHRRLFNGFDKVFVCTDDDDPGNDLAARVMQQVPSGVRVTLYPAKDANQALVEYGVDFIKERFGL